MKPEFTAKIPTDQLWNPTVHYYTEFLTQKSVIKTTEQAVHLNGFEEDLSQIPELLMTEIVVNSKTAKARMLLNSSRCITQQMHPFHFDITSFAIAIHHKAWRWMIYIHFTQVLSPFLLENRMYFGLEKRAGAFNGSGL